MNTVETIIASDIHPGSNYPRADKYKEYFRLYDAITHLAIHGHQFDNYINDYEKAPRTIYRFHKFLQDIEHGDSTIGRYLLKSPSSWFNLSYKKNRSAVGYATVRCIDNISCSYRYKPMSLISDNVNNYNSGSQTSKLASLISICEKGVTIHGKH